MATVIGNGTNLGEPGVLGESQEAEGVRGIGHKGAGVSGTSEKWIGTYGESREAEGVRGDGHKGAGVSGTSEKWIGTYGESQEFARRARSKPLCPWWHRRDQRQSDR